MKNGVYFQAISKQFKMHSFMRGSRWFYFKIFTLLKKIDGNVCERRNISCSPISDLMWKEKTTNSGKYV